MLENYNIINYLSGTISLAFAELVGPASSLQAPIAFSFSKTRAYIGVLSKKDINTRSSMKLAYRKTICPDAPCKILELGPRTIAFQSP